VARQRRLEVPGGLYHVITRGIERRNLFCDDADRIKYLELLEKASARFGFRLYSYCLMSNHVHLALATGDLPLRRIMSSINTTYAGYFNNQYRRSGYLFQGRFKAFLVDREAYLLSLVRYIHDNPVKAGIVAKAEEFRWSSHQSYIGRPPSWLHSDEVLKRFSRRRSAAIRNFQAFFSQVEEDSYSASRPVAQLVVGGEAFAQAALERLPQNEPFAIRRLTAADLVAWVAHRNGLDLPALYAMARKDGLSHARALCGYLGPFVGISTASIARELRRNQPNLWRSVDALERSARENTKLRKDLDRCRKELTAHSNKILMI